MAQRQSTSVSKLFEQTSALLAIFSPTKSSWQMFLAVKCLAKIYLFTVYLDLGSTTNLNDFSFLELFTFIWKANI